ncbi:hypothetical protein L1049_016825 [Liquidambar formosana]|uniref:DUF4283 domain-containing protein n=1 Tax=Liquidambar formosana TaxID=63359 RepID=A0AAP0X3C1_LIQFO
MVNHPSDKEIKHHSHGIETMQIEEVDGDWLKRSVFDITVRFMGGLLVLLEFHSEEVMKSHLEDTTWLDQWVKDIRSWHPNLIIHERLVWLSITGVPLHAWVGTNFRKIGERFGAVIFVDSNTHNKTMLDRGRILVSTKLLEPISKDLVLEVCNENFLINVKEESVVSLSCLNSPAQCKSKHQVVGVSSPAVSEEQVLHVENSNSPFAEKCDSRLDSCEGENVAINLSSLDQRGCGNWKRKEALSNSAILNNSLIPRNPVVQVVKSHSRGPGFKTCSAHNADGPPSTGTPPMLRKAHSLDTPARLFRLGLTTVYHLEKPDALIREDCESRDQCQSNFHSKRSISLPSSPVKGKLSRVSTSAKSHIAPSRDFHEFQCESSSFDIGVALEPGRDSRKPKALAKSARKKKKLLGDILGWKKKCLRSKKVVKKKGRKSLKEPIDVHSSHSESATISDGGIANRNQLILQEANDTWNVMQRVGFRSLGNDQEILDKISELEVRDWEIFGKNC